MFPDNGFERRKAMKAHLRAGVTPALFEMDALRVTEMQWRAKRQIGMPRWQKALRVQHRFFVKKTARTIDVTILSLYRRTGTEASGPLVDRPACPVKVGPDMAMAARLD